MPDSSHLIADRLANIVVTGSLVRIELGAMRFPTVEGQKPQLLPTQTLVMHLDGFVASFGMMESVMKQLTYDLCSMKGTYFPRAMEPACGGFSRTLISTIAREGDLLDTASTLSNVAIGSGGTSNIQFYGNVDWSAVSFSRFRSASTRFGRAGSASRTMRRDSAA